MPPKKRNKAAATKGATLSVELPEESAPEATAKIGQAGQSGSKTAADGARTEADDEDSGARSAGKTAKKGVVPHAPPLPPPGPVGKAESTAQGKPGAQKSTGSSSQRAPTSGPERLTLHLWDSIGRERLAELLQCTLFTRRADAEIALRLLHCPPGTPFVSIDWARTDMARLHAGAIRLLHGRLSKAVALLQGRVGSIQALAQVGLIPTLLPLVNMYQASVRRAEHVRLPDAVEKDLAKGRDEALVRSYDVPLDFCLPATDKASAPPLLGRTHASISRPCLPRSMQPQGYLVGSLEKIPETVRLDDTTRANGNPTTRAVIVDRPTSTYQAMRLAFGALCRSEANSQVPHEQRMPWLRLLGLLATGKDCAQADGTVGPQACLLERGINSVSGPVEAAAVFGRPGVAGLQTDMSSWMHHPACTQNPCRCGADETAEKVRGLLCGRYLRALQHDVESKPGGRHNSFPPAVTVPSVTDRADALQQLPGSRHASFGLEYVPRTTGAASLVGSAHAAATVGLPAAGQPLIVDSDPEAPVAEPQANQALAELSPYPVALEPSLQGAEARHGTIVPNQVVQEEADWWSILNWSAPGGAKALQHLVAGVPLTPTYIGIDPNVPGSNFRMDSTGGRPLLHSGGGAEPPLRFAPAEVYMHSVLGPAKQLLQVLSRAHYSLVGQPLGEAVEAESVHTPCAELLAQRGKHMVDAAAMVSKFDLASLAAHRSPGPGPGKTPRPVEAPAWRYEHAKVTKLAHPVAQVSAVGWCHERRLLRLASAVEGVVAEAADEIALIDDLFGSYAQPKASMLDAPRETEANSEAKAELDNFGPYSDADIAVMQAGERSLVAETLALARALDARSGTVEATTTATVTTTTAEGGQPQPQPALTAESALVNAGDNCSAIRCLLFDCLPALSASVTALAAAAAADTAGEAGLHHHGDPGRRGADHTRGGSSRLAAPVGEFPHGVADGFLAPRPPEHFLQAVTDAMVDDHVRKGRPTFPSTLALLGHLAVDMDKDVDVEEHHHAAAHGHGHGRGYTPDLAGPRPTLPISVITMTQPATLLLLDATRTGVSAAPQPLPADARDVVVANLRSAVSSPRNLSEMITFMLAGITAMWATDRSVIVGDKTCRDRVFGTSATRAAGVDRQWTAAMRVHVAVQLQQLRVWAYDMYCRLQKNVQLGCAMAKTDQALALSPPVSDPTSAALALASTTRYSPSMMQSLTMSSNIKVWTVQSLIQKLLAMLDIWDHCLKLYRTDSKLKRVPERLQLQFTPELTALITGQPRDKEMVEVIARGMHAKPRLTVLFVSACPDSHVLKASDMYGGYPQDDSALVEILLRAEQWSCLVDEMLNNDPAVLMGHAGDSGGSTELSDEHATDSDGAALPMTAATPGLGARGTPSAAAHSRTTSGDELDVALSPKLPSRVSVVQAPLPADGTGPIVPSLHEGQAAQSKPLRTYSGRKTGSTGGASPGRATDAAIGATGTDASVLAPADEPSASPHAAGAAGSGPWGGSPHKEARAAGKDFDAATAGRTRPPTARRKLMGPVETFGGAFERPESASGAAPDAEDRSASSDIAAGGLPTDGVNDFPDGEIPLPSGPVFSADQVSVTSSALNDDEEEDGPSTLGGSTRHGLPAGVAARGMGRGRGLPANHIITVRNVELPQEPQQQHAWPPANVKRGSSFTAEDCDGLDCHVQGLNSKVGRHSQALGDGHTDKDTAIVHTPPRKSGQYLSPVLGQGQPLGQSGVLSHQSSRTPDSVGPSFHGGHTQYHMDHGYQHNATVDLTMPSNISHAQDITGDHDGVSVVLSGGPGSEAGDTAQGHDHAAAAEGAVTRIDYVARQLGLHALAHGEPVRADVTPPGSPRGYRSSPYATWERMGQAGAARGTDLAASRGLHSAPFTGSSATVDAADTDSADPFSLQNFILARLPDRVAGINGSGATGTGSTTGAGTGTKRAAAPAGAAPAPTGQGILATAAAPQPGMADHSLWGVCLGSMTSAHRALMEAVDGRMIGADDGMTTAGLGLGLPGRIRRHRAASDVPKQTLNTTASSISSASSSRSTTIARYNDALETFRALPLLSLRLTGLVQPGSNRAGAAPSRPGRGGRPAGTMATGLPSTIIESMLLLSDGVSEDGPLSILAAAMRYEQGPACGGPGEVHSSGTSDAETITDACAAAITSVDNGYQYWLHMIEEEVEGSASGSGHGADRAGGAAAGGAGAVPHDQASVLSSYLIAEAETARAVLEAARDILELELQGIGASAAAPVIVTTGRADGPGAVMRRVYQVVARTVAAHFGSGASIIGGQVYATAGSDSCSSSSSSSSSRVSMRSAYFATGLTSSVPSSTSTTPTRPGPTAATGMGMALGAIPEQARVPIHNVTRIVGDDGRAVAVRFGANASDLASSTDDSRDVSLDRHVLDTSLGSSLGSMVSAMDGRVDALTHALADTDGQPGGPVLIGADPGQGQAAPSQHDYEDEDAEEDGLPLDVRVAQALQHAVQSLTGTVAVAGPVETQATCPSDAEETCSVGSIRSSTSSSTYDSVDLGMPLQRGVTARLATANRMQSGVEQAMPGLRPSVELGTAAAPAANGPVTALDLSGLSGEDLRLVDTLKAAVTGPVRQKAAPGVDQPGAKLTKAQKKKAKKARAKAKAREQGGRRAGTPVQDPDLSWAAVIEDYKRLSRSNSLHVSGPEDFSPQDVGGAAGRVGITRRDSTSSVDTTSTSGGPVRRLGAGSGPFPAAVAPGHGIAPSATSAHSAPAVADADLDVSSTSSASVDGKPGLRRLAPRAPRVNANKNSLREAQRLAAKAKRSSKASAAAAVNGADSDADEHGQAGAQAPATVGASYNDVLKASHGDTWTFDFDLSAEHTAGATLKAHGPEDLGLEQLHGPDAVAVKRFNAAGAAATAAPVDLAAPLHDRTVAQSNAFISGFAGRIGLTRMDGTDDGHADKKSRRYVAGGHSGHDTFEYSSDGEELDAHGHGLADTGDLDVTRLTAHCQRGAAPRQHPLATVVEVAEMVAGGTQAQELLTGWMESVKARGGALMSPDRADIHWPYSSWSSRVPLQAFPEPPLEGVWPVKTSGQYALMIAARQRARSDREQSVTTAYPPRTLPWLRFMDDAAMDSAASAEPGSLVYEWGRQWLESNDVMRFYASKARDRANTAVATLAADASGSQAPRRTVRLGRGSNRSVARAGLDFVDEVTAPHNAASQLPWAVPGGGAALQSSFLSSLTTDARQWQAADAHVPGITATLARELSKAAGNK